MGTQSTWGVSPFFLEEAAPSAAGHRKQSALAEERDEELPVDVNCGGHLCQRRASVPIWSDHCYPTLQLTGQACLVAATTRPPADIATAQTNIGATETVIGNTTNARTKRRVVLRKRCWPPPTSTGAAMGRAS